jgi:hypothetical protein
MNNFTRGLLVAFEIEALVACLGWLAWRLI